MPRLRLSDEDRARLNCPEFLPADLTRISVRDAIGLQKLGYPTPELFARALTVEPPDYGAWIGLVWLGLRRAGIDTDPESLDFDYVQMRVVEDPPDVEPKPVAGKLRARGPSRSSRRTSSTSIATSAATSTTTD